MEIDTKWGVKMQQHHFVWCPKCGFKEVEANILFLPEETLTCPKCKHIFQSGEQQYHTIRYDFPKDLSEELRAIIQEEFRQWAKEQGLPMTVNDLGQMA
jgi:hypothetical protein